MNLAEEIEKVAAGQPIEAVVIGNFDECDYQPNDEDPPFVNKVSSWAKARPFLDYNYNNGYGRADCHPVVAWTEARIIYVGEYDGFTRVSFVSRHPDSFNVRFF